MLPMTCGGQEMQSKNRATLRVQLDNGVHYTDADAFIEVISQTIALLKELNKAQSVYGSESLKWAVVDAGHSSPLFTEFAPVRFRDTDPDIGASVVHDFVLGIHHLEVSDTPPPQFSEPALHKASKLLQSLGRGVGVIQFSSNGFVATATKVGSANAQTAIAKYDLAKAVHSSEYQEYGSIEGHLRSLSEQAGGKDRIDIIEELTGQTIRCYIRSDFDHEAAAAWKKRVSVTGMITVGRRTRRPVSVQVESIRVLRDSSELPQIEDLFGIQITGGMSPEEYVRGLRDVE
jgi:hypothetical protein